MSSALSLFQEARVVTCQKWWDHVEQDSEDGGTTEEPKSARNLCTEDVGEMEIILGQKGNANAAKESVVVRHLYIYTRFEFNLIFCYGKITNKKVVSLFN